MTPYDLNNLNFLLNVSANELQKWYYSVDDLDHEYASQLMSAYSRELDLMTMDHLPMEDLSAARLVLDKFRL